MRDETPDDAVRVLPVAPLTLDRVEPEAATPWRVLTPEVRADARISRTLVTPLLRLLNERSGWAAA